MPGSRSLFRLPDPRVGAVVAALVLAAGLVFGRTAGHEFLNYDDDRYVVSNPMVRGGLTWSGVREAMTNLQIDYWHPLSWVSHMLDVRLFGMRPAGHHLVSVAWHAANGALLFLVLRSLTGALWRSAFVAGLFALHPLRVESVAWVAERKDVLAAFFWIAATGAYVRFARRPGPGSYLATAMLFALGLAAKPMLVTLPLTLVLLDGWPLGRFQRRTGDKTAGAPARSLAGSIGGKIPFFLLAAGAALLTVIATSHGRSMSSLEDFPAADRLGNAAVSCMLYIAKSAWPSRLAVLYPFTAPGPWKAVAALFMLAAVTAAALASRRTRPWLLFGWLWYLITLLPVIGLIQAGSQARADRYTYVPSIGLSVIFAWGAPEALRHLNARRGLPTLAALLCLTVLGGLAWRQTGFWKDSETLMEHTLAVTQRNPTAQNNLGVALLRQNRVDEALPHLEEAVRLEPGEPSSRFNLGAALLLKGDSAGAIRSFSEGLKGSPGDAQAQAWLGRAYLRANRPQEAAEHLAAALRIRPDMVEAGYDLELALRSLATKRAAPGTAQGRPLTPAAP